MVDEGHTVTIIICYCVINSDKNGCFETKEHIKQIENKFLPSESVHEH